MSIDRFHRLLRTLVSIVLVLYTVVLGFIGVRIILYEWDVIIDVVLHLGGWR